MKSLHNKPIFFEQNRVWRVYTGGALFADFFDDDSTDGYEPEEWIASSVRALNKESKGEKEGISQVKNTDLYFDELLKQYPKEMLGDRTQFGVLIKMLDSAIRLPIQAHPDKDFSRKYFHSEYGKTESWIVLATRPGAALYFGFKQQLSKEQFAEAVQASETNKNVMEQFLNRVEVQPGDVFLVPARMVHAIGKGCMILEIQEPTDFTIQPEYWCGDYHLSHDEMYIGLPEETALDVFDYNVYGEEAVAKGRCHPRVLCETEHCIMEELISYEDTPCFSVQRYNITNGECKLTHAPAVYVITDGEGEMQCADQTWSLKKGDYFFLPYAAKEQVVLNTCNRLEVVVCLPPIEQ